jgi:hypothetical protein
MSNYIVEYNKPIRFLAIEWRESGWEFDHPSVLLEPFIRYSPNGESCEGLIEDACIDICVDTDLKHPIRAEIHGSDAKEFKWRGWDLQKLRDYAEILLGGVVKGIPLGTGFIKVHEEYITFVKNKDGETVWSEDDNPIKEAKGFSTSSEFGD